MQDPSLYSQIKAQVMTQQPQFPETDHIMIKCPRCDSTNTKFCYYNNYNLSQPRHFCKNCRRYWTKGGALRNIPIGGGSRKNNTKRVSNKRLAPVPDNDSTGKNGETLSLIGENFGGHFGDLMEVSGSGSFSSLLGEGHFGNLLDGPSLQMGDPDFGDPGSGQGVDPQLGLESGGDNSECWSGGSNVWPDLSIYTPGSTLH